MRCKIKTQTSKPIAQYTEKSPTKIAAPNISKTKDMEIQIADYIIPSVTPKGDIGTKVIDRKIIQNVTKEIPIYPDPVYRPPPKPVKHLYLKFLEAYWILTQKWTQILKQILHFKKG